MLLGNIIKLKYCWAFPSLHLNPQLKQLLIQDADATIHSQMFFDAALWYFNSLLTASGNFLRPAKFAPILNGRKFLTLAKLRVKRLRRKVSFRFHSCLAAIVWQAHSFNRKQIKCMILISFRSGRAFVLCIKLRTCFQGKAGSHLSPAGFNP